jgi:ubiquinone biosynthesis protein
MRSLFRLLRIVQVLLRWRLDELLGARRPQRLFGLLRLLLARSTPEVALSTRGMRVRRALEELGPIFVKFGQILSTRRDLLPPDVAAELALLQDRVAPFPGEEARALVESELGAPVADLFEEFDTQPLASASVAQVHAARLPGGREVVLKVLRPGVGARVATDLSLLRTLGGIAQKRLPDAERIQPLELVAEIERTLRDELDLQREGANASLIRRNFAQQPDDLLIPEVIWSLSRGDVLTMERVRGIPSDDVAALDAAGIDRAKLAAKGVRVFYTQVFRDNFFHADAHAGNIWVDAERRDEPRFIALDFGIMGSLSPADQYYLAENFSAMFTRDYRRIAELHVEAGWIPASVRLDDLEAAVRSVCEPYFTRPLSEISLGEVLVKLFKVAHRFELTIQPQLLLLQKTLLNIEGVGRLLDPKLDIWAVAKPVLDAILRERYSFGALVEDFRKRVPELVVRAPEFPRLVHAYLSQATRGEQTLQMRSKELAQLVRVSRRAQHGMVLAVLGAGALVSASVLWALDAPGMRIAGIPLAAWAALAASALAFVAAMRRP